VLYLHRWLCNVSNLRDRFRWGFSDRVHEIIPASVVLGIVTRNRAVLLAKAIQSVFEQDMPGLQVAVIDDGSTDATPDLKAQFPNIRWTRYEQTRGLIAARNQLMRSASEDYFVSLDDDAWFLRGDEISTAVRHLEKNKQVAAIAFDILSPDRPQSIERKNPEPAAMFTGCGHVLRLTSAREVGFYELPPGEYGGEEKDLCLRLMDAGYRIDRLPGVHVWHDKTMLERHTPDQHRSGVCNDLVMALRRTPLLLLPAALLAKVLRHLTFSLRNGLTKPFFGGLWLFLRSSRAVWSRRRSVQMATLRKFIELSRS